MTKVKFYNIHHMDDKKLLFAVIVAKYKDKWVLVKHKDRHTWEIPGGHHEIGESIDECAKRELVEETGAKSFSIAPVCIYSVVKENKETLGKLFYAKIDELGALGDFEIEKVEFFDELPKELTYPLIQPFLFKKVLNHI